MKKQTNTPTHLDQKFWQNFSKNIWEKEPLAIKNAKSPLLEIGEAEIFRMLVIFSDRCRKLKNADGFKFYIDGLQAHPQDVLQILPVKKDQSLLGYHKRMNTLFSDYCLVCDELLKTSSAKNYLLSDFTDELYRYTGFPNQFAEMGLYLGNYRKTPFGVHVDNCGVFSFPVVGQKKFRLWTSDFVKKNPALDRAFSYKKFNKNSQVLIAEAGDMTYWPSSAWHIAESDGQFSATWSLGIWVEKPHKKLFSEYLNYFLSEKFGARGNLMSTAFKELHATSGQVTELPAAFEESLKLLQSLSSAELKESFLKLWMQHISLQGFKNIPVVNIQLRSSSRVKLRSDRAKILWQSSKIQRNKVFVAYGGITVETQKSSGLFKFITAVNAGETCLLSDFIKSQNKADLRSLQKLAECGAFVK